MTLADILILVVVGAMLYFAVRAMVRSKKKGQCLGCNEKCCGACCHQAALKREGDESFRRGGGGTTRLNLQ